MKILLAYSSKTKNTKKVAEAIYEQIKDQAEVDLLDIKKQRKRIEKEYDFYILGAWTDKTNANKNITKLKPPLYIILATSSSTKTDIPV